MGLVGSREDAYIELQQKEHSSVMFIDQSP